MVALDEGEQRYVCSTDDVTPDSGTVVGINGSVVAIFESNGSYFAVDNTCPHQGGPLGEGKVEDGCVYCPWHGWQFDLDSGEHVHGKETATTYDVAIKDGSIYLQAQ